MSKKNCCKLFNRFIITFLSLIILLNLSSCKNFFEGSEILDELNDTIKYLNASNVTLVISPEEGTGSTIPYGNYDAKIGYPFEIKFNENSAYKFIKWVAVDVNEGTDLTNIVQFENINDYTTTVTITENKEIRIYPLCEKRIELSTEPSPRYEPNGVSRDRSITVEFTKAPASNCFIFSENEIPSGAEKITNSEGQIWAYKLGGYTYLKNISITNADEISIAEHFNQPVIEGNRVTVSVNREKPIEFEAGVILKTIIVTLSSNICDEIGVSMNSDKIWRYQVTEATDEKATITLAANNNNEGQVYLAGTKEYYLDQKISLIFTENPDYQFLYWSYDNAIISVTEPKNPSTTAIVKDKTTDKGTEIKAICAPRLRVENFSPVTNSEVLSVAKDRAIEISFNKAIPTDEESLKQLNNINISVGGVPVNTSFSSAKINDKKVTFVADRTNMIDVPEGQTKTVTVSIPDDFYYLLEDGTKVTYGGSGKIFSYIINETTFDKAGVSYSVTEGSGTINIDTSKQPFEYSLSQVIPLKFTPNDGWNFYGWDVLDSEGKAVDKKYLEVKKEKDGEYYLYVKESIQGITIKPDCSEQLKIVSVTPDPEGVNPKDKNIEITFNKNIDESCSGELDKIKIYIDSVPSDDFETRTIQGNKIIIINTKIIPVEKNTTKKVIFEIPDDFKYNDGIRDIKLEEKMSSNYTINHLTEKKTFIKYILSGSSSQIKIDDELISTGNNKDYNIGQIIKLEYPLSNEYDFTGWKIETIDTDFIVKDNKENDISSSYTKKGTMNLLKGTKKYLTIDIDDENPNKATLTILNSVEKGVDGYGVSISAGDIVIPKITSAKAGNNPELYHRLGYECDAILSFTFNTEIKEENLTLSEPKENKSLKTQNNIDIVSDQDPTKHYEDYFSLQYDRITKTLKLIPNTKIKELVKNDVDTFDLQINFNGENILNNQNNKLMGELSYLYRINGTQESVKPTDVTVEMFKDAEYKTVVEKVNKNSTTLSYLNKYYLHVKAKDIGGKIKAVKIKETLINDYGGDEIDTSLQITYEDQYGIDSFNSLNDDYYEFFTPVDFKSLGDGRIKLEISVVDYAGNESDNPFINYVVKDTAVPSPNRISLIQAFFNSHGTDFFNLKVNDDLINFNDNNKSYKYKVNLEGIDTPYGGKNSTFKLTSKELSWGYDEDCSEKIQEVTKENEIEVDPTRNVYFKMSLCDDAGNMVECMRVIPAMPRIIDWEEKKDNYNNTFLQVHVADENKQKLLVLEEKADAYDCKLYCAKYNETSQSLGDFTGFSNINIFAKNNTGIYYVYALPYFTYNDNYYYYGLCSSNYLKINIKEDKTWKISLEDPKNDDITVPDNNSGCNYTVAPAEINKQYRTVTFDYGNFIKEPDIDYYIESTPKGSNCFGLTPIKTLNTTNIFNLESGSEYDISIKAVDENGNYKESEILFSVDLTDFDNCPPYYNPDSIKLTNVTSNCIKLIECDETKIPKDIGSDLYKNKEGKYEIDYYLIPRSNSKIDKSTKFSYEKLITTYSQYKHTITFENEYKQLYNSNTSGYYSIDFPYNFIDEGYYDFCFILKDINGNYTIHSMGVYSEKNIADSKTAIPKDVKLDTNSITFNVKITKSGFSGIAVHNEGYLTELYNQTNNRWEPIEGTLLFNNKSTDTNCFICIPNDNVYNVKYELPFTTNNTTDFPFIRINHYYYQLISNPEIVSSCPNYVYLPYKVNPENYPCLNKNILDCGKNGFQIFCDAPCLVHTLYSSNNLGEEPKLWYSRGTEVKNAIKQESENFTYEVPLTDIPENSYYVIVAHYADGTTKMSEVKQK